jgi:hypothetical protein
MEHTAYFSAIGQFGKECFPERDNDKISMAELFDVISGSETGALIAGSLNIKNDDPTLEQPNKYFATKAMDYFNEDNSYELYSSQNLSWYTKSIIYTIVAIIFMLLAAYVAGRFLNTKVNQ